MHQIADQMAERMGLGENDRQGGDRQRGQGGRLCPHERRGGFYRRLRYVRFHKKVGPCGVQPAHRPERVDAAFDRSGVDPGQGGEGLGQGSKSRTRLGGWGSETKRNSTGQDGETGRFQYEDG